MSTLGERKSALLLLTLHPSDRRRLLSALPISSATAVRKLISALERSEHFLPEIAAELLGDEVRGLTEGTSPGVEELVALSRRMPAPWYARVLSVWTGVDQGFCLALLDDSISAQVRKELAVQTALPAKLIDALRIEAAALAVEKREAA